MKNLKLQLVEYFDIVVNQIDLFTETKIADHNGRQLDEIWNDRRDQQIEFVKNVERATLARFDRLKLCQRTEQLDWTRLLEESCSGEFCFTVHLADLLFVVKVNRYISPVEIDVFKTLLKWSNLSDQERHAFLTNGNDCFEVDHYWIGEEATNLIEMFTQDSSIVDAGAWFNRQYHIEQLVLIRVNSVHSIDLQLRPAPFRINTIEIILFGYIRMSLEEAVEKIKLIDRCYDQVNNLIIHVENFSFTQIKDLEQLVRWNEKERKRLSVQAFCNSSESRLASTHDLSQASWLRKIQLSSAILSLPNTKLVWPHVEELSLRQTTIARSIDSTLFEVCSQRLRHLTLSHCTLDQTRVVSDWSFLDPIRPRLESLKLIENKLIKISWKLFRDMTNLRLLVIHETELSQIELDENGQMFGDLTRLDKLVLHCQLNSTTWSCRLPLLHELDLYLVNFNNLPLGDIQTSSNYKLPRLSALRVHIDQTFEQKDLSRLFKCFSHVRKLFIELPGPKILINGLVDQFKQLEKMTLECQQNPTRTFAIESAIFNGLKSLRALELVHPTKIELDALRSLTKLESIIIRCRNTHLLEMDKLASLFDGLWSLKRVDHSFSSSGFNSQSSTTQLVESFVYFENLKKFILVLSD